MIFSVVDPGIADDEELLHELGNFLRRFGRDANQGEVGVIVGFYYHPIVDFMDDDTASPDTR